MCGLALAQSVGCSLAFAQSNLGWVYSDGWCLALAPSEKCSQRTPVKFFFDCVTLIKNALNILVAFFDMKNFGFPRWDFFWKKKWSAILQSLTRFFGLVFMTGGGLRVFGVLFGGSLHFRISHFVG